MSPIHAALVVALHALLSNAAALRQPATQTGAVEAREKLEPAATPISKVIQLLKGLEKQIEEEGAKEAAEYDKFACFCKEQADQKLYMIEKSTEKIEALTASIAKLEADITLLGTQISELADRIEELEGKIEAEVEARAEEHKVYKENDDELASAIETVDYALKVLRSSRDELKDAKLSESLLQKVAGRAMALAPLAAASSSLAEVLKQKPAAYQYKSSSVIETLMEIRDIFAKTKKDYFNTEMEKKSISDKTVLSWTNERNFKEEDKTQKEALSDKKTQEKHSQEKDKQQEETDKERDEAFQAELTAQCQTRAEEWDQRSKARADELQAIAEATEILKSGVEENYAANKKLVGLSAVVRSVARASKNVSKPVSLFQLRGQGSAAVAAGAVRHVVETLEGAAKRVGSTRLNAIATKVALQEDHFGKVRGLIEDLIARLEAEALAEADQKSFCDKEIGAAVGTRDQQKSEMETQGATISKKETAIAGLTKDIALLSTEISELQKALNDATVLRLEEKTANEKTIADATAGLEAVEEAITILEAYYAQQGGRPALVQRGAAPAPAPQGYESFHPEGGDRKGNTVGDLAPEMSYEGEYKGKASGGVLGLMQVIKADFQRTIETVGTAEADAQEAFEKFETEAKDSIMAKGELKEQKEGEINEAEGAIVDAQDAHKDADTLHEGALEELDKLKAMCVEGAESYEERGKKREQEIEALKEALGILENFNK